MGDFFKVGEQYENRFGTYEVLEVKTPTIRIRYTANHRLQEVEELLQERIVRNLLREREIANRPPEAKRVSDRPKTQRRRRVKFDGFVAADFDDATPGGSGWRTKAGLAGWLAEVLAERTGTDLASWVPSRQPLAYITTTDQTGSDKQYDSAQYFITTGSTGVRYGVLVRRPADSTEGATAWDRLLANLGEDEPLGQTLTELLTSGAVELSWWTDAAGRSERETVTGDENGLRVGRTNATEADTIEALGQRLQAAPQDQALWLSVETELATQDAQIAGAGLADTMLDLLVQVAPVFGACIG